MVAHGGEVLAAITRVGETGSGRPPTRPSLRSLWLKLDCQCPSLQQTLTGSTHNTLEGELRCYPGRDDPQESLKRARCAVLRVTLLYLPRVC
jgi:hypothetical protein